MYKILHYIFGWDYVYWRNSADQGVARVHRTEDGRAFYWRYKITHLADFIDDPSKVGWLTCRPEKYITEKE